MEKRNQERNEIEIQRRELETQFLKNQNDNLEKFLKSLETTKSS
jgi:hypothetical protein